MRKITNITADPQQRHIIEVEEKSAILTLKYSPITESWTFDVEYNGQKKYGFKLSLGVLHLNNYNWPFDFIIIDTLESGIDPFKLDDFATGRIELYIFDTIDMESIRGYDVQI